MTERLQPARFEDTKAPAEFKQKKPWLLVASVLAFIAAAVFIYSYTQHQKRESHKKKIVTILNSSVDPALERSTEFEKSLDQLLDKTKKKPSAQTTINKDLSLDTFLSSSILYFRVTDEIRKHGWRGAAQAASHDVIGRCLGITMTPGYALTTLLDRVAKNWRADMHAEDRNKHLEVLESTLQDIARDDVPNLLDLVQPEYIFITAPRAGRMENPVDIYVFDGKSKKLVYEKRIHSEGRLLQARKAHTKKNMAPAMAAFDCGIAAAFRDSFAGKEDSNEIASDSSKSPSPDAP